MVDDFVENGRRVDHLVLFVKMGEYELREFWFSNGTSRDFIQWLLNDRRLFIKTGDMVGEMAPLFIFIEPTEEFLRKQLTN